MTISHIKCIAYILLLSIGLASCSAEMPMPVMITTTVIADKELNQNADGMSTPVQVKIFYLTSDAEFKTHDFFTLFEKGDQVLGKNLLAMKEVFIAPDKIMKVAVKVDPSVAFVAVLGAFRKVDTGTWSSVIMVPNNQPSSLIAYLSKLEITLQPDKTVKEGWFY
ncbi:type VI secretion system lipoprotein TssJ [Pseudovibrio sp. Ad26]|uniref:type VI secretion system lipoprotein TssJ n=1 Tax=Pseudovibrio sp. Ad26 TaxID=989410 RepID=UPI0007B1CDF3|nr:type VI secretion system lipoprotein TssJ [Pseudovibrio sp. Ad26]KZL10838.1 Type VI secretion lipoprotein [Pseudovibrio sp. Ad26]